MSRAGKLALAFGVFALMAAPALAQGQGRGFGGGFGGGAMLLTNKSVQTEIKATEDQVSKLTTFSEEFRNKAREAMQGFQDLSQEERRAKMAEVQPKLQADMDKALAEILKPEQLKRFHQIQLQQRGAQALLDARVADELKLTDDQKTKLREINQEAMTQTREIAQGFQDDREGTMKKMAEHRKATTEKALKVLTAEQKKSYDELAGSTFEVKYEPRPN